MPLRQTASLPRCAPKRRPSSGAAPRTRALSSSAQPSCVIADRVTRSRVQLPVREFALPTKAQCIQLFETAYRRLYSRSIPGVEIEVLSWVVTLSAPAEGELAKSAATKSYKPKAHGHRPVFDPDSGEFQEVPVFWRPDLEPGAEVSGPAVIAEDETSTVISPLFDAAHRPVWLY